MNPERRDQALFMAAMCGVALAGATFGMIAGFSAGRAGPKGTEAVYQRARAAVREEMLAEAQKAANKRGIKWDSEQELAELAFLSDFMWIPIGFTWQYRRWENGALVYRWGQIGFRDSLFPLFEPTVRQPAQAVRTLSRSQFWWAVKWALDRPTDARVELQRAMRAPVLTEPQEIVCAEARRKSYVGFAVDYGWKARAGREGQKSFILDEWNAWDTERGTR